MKNALRAEDLRRSGRNEDGRLNRSLRAAQYLCGGGRIQKADLALAEPQRLGFEPGIDLGIDPAKDRFLEGGCDYDLPMSNRRRVFSLPSDIDKCFPA